MNCETAQGLIPLLAADELDSAQAAALRAHLESCSMCRREYDEVVELTAALSAADDEGLRDSERRRMQETAIASLADPNPVDMGGRRATRPMPVWLRVAAAIAIFFLGFGANAWLNRTNGPELVAPPQAQPAYSSPLLARSDAARLRLSARGFQLIARGQAALEER